MIYWIPIFLFRLKEFKEVKMAVGKYTVFTLDNERYAVPISKVQEVIRFTPITPLHDVNPFLKGVINLRGKIIPVIDMRLKFGLPEKPYNDRTVFIIVEFFSGEELYHTGLIVDGVKEVVEIDEDKIEKTPEVGFKFKTKYLNGIIQIGGEMVMILNLDNILTTEEVVELEQKMIVSQK